MKDSLWILMDGIEVYSSQYGYNRTEVRCIRTNEMLMDMKNY
jgi:hypothetical protein